MRKRLISQLIWTILALPANSIEYDLAGQVPKITRPNGTVHIINYDAAGRLRISSKRL